MTRSSTVADSILLAGSMPGERAGNAVSTEVLLEALRRLGKVSLLAHRIAPVPNWHRSRHGAFDRITIGTQPFCIHGEALLAGRLHRRQLHAFPCAWVVNSRYAGALYAAGVPYVIWEATTTRDELRVTTVRAVREAGRGTGLGRLMHWASLPLGERIEGALYRAAVKVLAMSEYTRELILDTHHLDESRVRVLTHPPAPAFVHALASLPTTARKAPAPDGPWRLLFVGRADDPRKNFQLLLHAVRGIRGRNPAATLTVVGPHSDQWRRKLGLEGLGDAVAFAGAVSVETLAAAYRQHDLLLVPSRQEGFGIIVAEAFAAGLPVVATRCGGPEAMIRQSGAGLLVDHDPTAMASAAIGVLSDSHRWQTMANLALRYGAGALNFERFASAVADITATARAAVRAA